jgi:hypothetical protein
MEPMRNVVSNNSRINAIRKFVMKPPARGATLRLVSCEDTPQTLGEWTRDECADNAVRAEEVDSALTEHRDATERNVTALLVWLSLEGGSVVSKRLHCRMEAAEETTPELAALGIDGTDRGTLMQTQQHLHVVMTDTHALQRTLIAGLQALTVLQRDLIRDQNEQLRDLYADRHTMHEQLGDLTAQVRSGPEPETEESEGGPESEARAELMRTLTDGVKQVALPMALRALAGGKEG